MLKHSEEFCRDDNCLQIEKPFWIMHHHETVVLMKILLKILKLWKKSNYIFIANILQMTNFPQTASLEYMTPSVLTSKN